MTRFDANVISFTSYPTVSCEVGSLVKNSLILGERSDFSGCIFLKTGGKFTEPNFLRTFSGAVIVKFRNPKNSSNLTAWRRQRDAGELAPGAPKKRGRKPDKQAKRLAQLERENERLRAQLEQAELIIGAPKKLAQALENALSDKKDEIS